MPVLFAILIASVAKSDEVSDLKARFDLFFQTVVFSGFEGQTNKYSLSQLNRIAADYISSKDPRFPTNTMPFPSSVYISIVKTNQVVRLGYIRGGLGGNAWWVSVGKDGKAFDYGNGVATDKVGTDPIP